MSSQSDTGNLISDNYHYLALWGITMTPEITKLLKGNLWPYGIMAICAYNVTEGVKLGMLKADDAPLIYFGIVMTAIIYGLVVEFIKSYQTHIDDLRKREDRIIMTNEKIADSLERIDQKLTTINDNIKQNDILRKLEVYLTDKAK